MGTLKDKEFMDKLFDALEKNSKLLEVLKKQTTYSELTKFVTIYIAVLISAVVIMLIW